MYRSLSVAQHVTTGYTIGATTWCTPVRLAAACEIGFRTFRCWPGISSNACVQESGKKVQGFTDEGIGLLQRHRWPGNVRELQNVIKRAVLFGEIGTWSGRRETCRR